MSIWTEIKDAYHGTVTPASEKDKTAVIEEFISKIESEKFSANDRSEIVNRVALRVFERHREQRTRLIQKAREVQEAMININLPKPVSE